MSILGLPNLEGIEDLVRRMEAVAESMADSAERTEASAEVMFQAAVLTDPEPTE